MKKIKRKEKLIKERLEFFDALVSNLRRRIEDGEPIPSINVLIQPK
jgi:hypothetical protein